MKEYYSLPLLFEKFYLAKGVVELLNNHPYIFRDSVVIESFYGSNGGILNGGRLNSPNDINSIDIIQVSDFMNQIDISPVIVMSNLLVDKKDIPDNYAIKIVTTFEHKKLFFCVANKNVEDWLEKYHYNRGQFILSTTVCDDIQTTINKTDRYKKIVLNETFVNHWSEIRKIPEQTRKKLEIVVNMSCPTDCTLRRIHYEDTSLHNIKYDYNTKEFVCPYIGYKKDGFLFQRINNDSFVSLDKIGSYLNLGINHFKIEGRGGHDNILIETMAYFLIKPEYQLMFREKLNDIIDYGKN